MAKQLDLFETAAPKKAARPAKPPKRKPKARSRNTDPESSELAADAMNKKGKTARHCERLTDVVIMNYRKDTGGITAAEAAELADDIEIDRYEAGRRLSQCEDIEKGPVRVCRVLGSRCATWIPKGATSNG